MFQPERMAREETNSLLYLVYGWMAFALSVTALTAYYVAHQPAVYSYIFSTPGLPMILFISQMALVVALGFGVTSARLSYTAAVTLFVIYAASLGITLSTIFFVYSAASIYATFMVTAGMFGTMALYGYYTKTDLTTVGSFASMALWGLILGLLVNMFLKNAAVDYVLSAVGVVLFTVLTAYDVQKIKQLAYTVMPDEQTRGKVALLGALTLYLDFINLFLYMLRFMGKKKD